jgi:hypothetical protein
MKRRPEAKAVLLALADDANDAGENAFPSVFTIAAEVEIGTRTADAVLAGLRAQGLIEEQEPPRQHRPRTWRINLAALAALAAPQTVAALTADRPAGSCDPDQTSEPQHAATLKSSDPQNQNPDPQNRAPDPQPDVDEQENGSTEQERERAREIAELLNEHSRLHSNRWGHLPTPAQDVFGYLLKHHDSKTITRALAAYFAADDEWVVDRKHPIRLFRKQFDSWAAASKTSAGIGTDQRWKHRCSYEHYHDPKCASVEECNRRARAGESVAQERAQAAATA